MAPVVVMVSSPMLIDPNPEVIEPPSRAPTVTKDVLPAFAEYVSCAVVEFNLVSN